MASKAELLPAPLTRPVFQRSSSHRPILFILGVLSVTLCYFSGTYPTFDWSWADGAIATEDVCPQASPLFPSSSASLFKQLDDSFSSDDFVSEAAELLGGAVRIKTESYDAMGPVGEDPRWEAFKNFHEYLAKTFPNVHSTLKLTKINTYGLFYVWQGSDASLKPLLLMAHQDVVPVDPRTENEWVHPPYSGHFDGEYIWGRGSADDKSGLIGVMTTVEKLLEKGFEPKRSMWLSFGFDEEASGVHGAQSIAKHLVETYGKDSVAMIVDEGGGFGERFGSYVAAPGVGEKGYIDVRVHVSTSGGHSSVPPAHTSIGILSALLVHLESNTIIPHLGRTTPIYKTVQCIGAHASSVPRSLRKDILKSSKSDKAMRRVEKVLFEERMVKAVAGTTQAIDLIGGGVKTNALPEEAWAVVNHRVAVDSSLDAIKMRDTMLLAHAAAKFNLSITAFGKPVSNPHHHCHSNPDQTAAPAVQGHLEISDAWGTALPPAPITPYSADAGPWQLLSGTIRAAWRGSKAYKETGEDMIVAPSAMGGNTDTRYYWDLTRHIFRYGHHGASDVYGEIHTVNEAIKATGIVQFVRFMTMLILNADESTEL